MTSEDYLSNLAMKYGAVVGSIVTGVPFYLLCIYKPTRLGIFDKMSGELLHKLGLIYDYNLRKDPDHDCFKTQL